MHVCNYACMYVCMQVIYIYIYIYEDDDGEEKSSGKKLFVPKALAVKILGGGESKIDDEEKRDGKYDISDPLKIVTDKGLVQCTMIRKRSFGTSFLTPHYELYVEGPTASDSTMLLVAHKKFKGKCMYYQIFDATKGGASMGKLHKKSGNYLGKLKYNLDGSRLTLYGRNEGETKTEMGYIQFDTQNIITSFLSAPVPRKIKVILPGSARDKDFAIPNKVMPGSDRTLITRAESNDTALFRFNNKEPDLEDGVYRLNFKGLYKYVYIYA